MVEIAPQQIQKQIEVLEMKHVFFIGITLLLAALHSYQPETEMISPVPAVTPTPTPTATPTPSPTPAHTRSTRWVGVASYYSEDGCLGCSPTLTMANGDRLDDTKLTVAFNRRPLNTFLLITNSDTGQSVRSKVTDTGGFERHGKIIDLSVATRDAIGCGSTCQVEIVVVD